MSSELLIEIDIDRLSYDGGRGIGRHNGLVVFVPFTAPGDRVQCRVVSHQKNYLVGEVVEIIKASEVRRAPLCPVFTRCGGCRWQNIKYEAQLNEKEQFIRHALRDFLNTQIDLQIYTAPKDYNYRNRIQVHKKNGVIGYFAEGTHQLVEIEACYIASEKINAELPRLRSNEYPDGKYEISEKEYGVNIKNLKDSPIEFSQVNSEQNQVLREQVMAGLFGKSFKFIYDFYCGSGNFTFQLALAFVNAQIIAVEANDLAVGRGLEKYESLRHGRIAKIHWFSKDVAQFIKQVEPTNETLFIVNPPRAGLENAVVSEILRLRPATIVYVSCNLSTLERDLKKLAPAYYVQRVAGVDMFPQTEYIECVAHLSLK